MARHRSTGMIIDAERRAARTGGKDIIPNRLVIAMFTLAIGSVVFTAASVAVDAPHQGQPVPGEIVERHVMTLGGEGNAALVTDETGRVMLDSYQGGFITVVRDGLDRARLVAGVEGNPPVTVEEYADGRLSLLDPASDWRIELTSFGTQNLTVWHALLAQ